MIAQAASLQPRRLFIVGADPESILEDLIDLWEEGCRSLVTVVAPVESAIGIFKARYEQRTDLSSISWLKLDAATFAAATFLRARELLATESLLVKIRLDSDAVLDVDLLPAELPEQPLREMCDFVQVRDLLAVGANDLTSDEVKAFFTKASTSWRPFGAGLPWQPDEIAQSDLIRALSRVLHSSGAPEPELLSISCASGAGGTTLARTLAYSAARDGFLPVVIKGRSQVPTALELTSFMFRSVEIVKNRSAQEEAGTTDAEPAWLVVLDVEHFDRQQQALWRYMADLARSGRKIVVLKVADARDPLQPPREIRHTEIAELRHELDREGVEHLGAHLNRFLKPHGWEKSSWAWMDFWEKHRPDVDFGIASFWVTLEFWLAGYLEMGSSIQRWLFEQFKNARVSDEVKLAALEIAAYSVERRALPERLLAHLETPNLPWRDALDKLRVEAPALGLINARSATSGNVWAMAHDSLARYLVNGVFGDILFVKALGFPDFSDQVALRLELIGRPCRRSTIVHPDVRDFVIGLATTTLKLDEQHGNPELFPTWRQALNLLDSIPSEIKEHSRSFNHHLAISRRRVVYGDVFQASDDEKLRLLAAAEKEVTYALERIAPTPEDEPDLHLFNTLALVYQDLALLERSTTNRKDRIAVLLKKSDQATHRALSENPSNSYVLETAARNLLRRAPDQAPLVQVREASEALAFVSQAFLLDTAILRRESLGRLAQEALSFLVTREAAANIERLCQEGNSFGFMAKAWLFIADSSPRLSLPEAIEKMSPETAIAAISILATSVEREWPLVRFLLQLNAVARPFDFKEEILLFEELASFPGYRLSLQQRVERAVVLHQVGRHRDANSEFGEIRKMAKTSGQILSLPSRLRWLLAPNNTRRLVCTATFQDRGLGRAMAEIREMAGALVPLRVQEFGKDRMAPGERFRCWVSFSPMGAFLKPTDTSSGDKR
ncbi:hypothetical protein [Variovorax guangxiensis]|uniref:hypothetical protein n=1 Tax=Variovorax guangxiensis TaxID=1775474 RepID=UPI0028567038|nr:hypothetical protein [Variovorax guangxiensis]MDR6855309.1 hypothetical protein [Variovorax guangxiensis]